ALRGDVAYRPRQSLDQEVDERLQMMPILMRLGIEDDAAVAGRKLVEAAKALPVLPHAHDRRDIRCDTRRRVRALALVRATCPLRASCRGKNRPRDTRTS